MISNGGFDEAACQFRLLLLGSFSNQLIGLLNQLFEFSLAESVYFDMPPSGCAPYKAPE